MEFRKRSDSKKAYPLKNKKSPLSSKDMPKYQTLKTPERQVRHHVVSKSEIPEREYYVVMIDTFMSGWGQADGKNNKLIIGASSLEEAEIVEKNAKDRSDQKSIQVHQGRSFLNNVKFNRDLVQYKDKSSMPRWFEKNAFEN